MKVGDLVMWHSNNEQDIGIVTKFNSSGDRVYISWISNDSNGLFDVGHPCIGVISYASW